MLTKKTIRFRTFTALDFASCPAVKEYGKQNVNDVDMSLETRYSKRCNTRPKHNLRRIKQNFYFEKSVT